MPESKPAPRGIRRLFFFGGLRIRPKLMVLHNLFFLVVAAAVYSSVIPLFEQQVERFDRRETQRLSETFGRLTAEDAVAALRAYNLQEGTARELGLSDNVRAELVANPGAVRTDPTGTYLYRLILASGRYQRVTLPQADSDGIVWRARSNLFITLGIIYVLAILVLELLIMPGYVYRPLRLMLDADRATQVNDRERELIDEKKLQHDEIGQIMRSRNATVRELRRQEDDLAATLARLEQVAADLQQKNAMLETAKQNLADQDRLVSLGLLSASVAHELNTPLAVLHGSVEKLLETVPTPAAQERLRRMLRVTQRLRTISEGLVDFARVRTHRLEPVRVRELIDEAWSLVSIDEKAGSVRLCVKVTPEEAVTGNFDRLIQVFVNLLRNALHAVDERGGMITACAQHVTRDGRDWMAITVEDNGPGIPPDVLPGIFEAFVTTRLDSRGTGLGLTVAEGIIQQHGGTISASNRPEGGARLEVILPAAHSEVLS